MMSFRLSDFGVKSGQSLTRKIGRVVLFLSLLSISSLLLYGQSVQGNIVGTVRDAQGAVVPGATVKVINESNGATRNLVTDANGNYHGIGFFVGLYRVEVSKEGFNTAVISGIKVDPVTEKRVDVTLQLGTIKQVVTVTGGAPVIQTEGPTVNTTLPTVLYNKPIEDTRTGWAYSAAMWAPGSAGGNGALFLWGGGIGSETQMEVEGIQQSLLMFVPQYSIQETSVISGAPPAEYARAVTINTTLKSGTNQLHGSWITSLLNPGVNAQNTPFNDTKRVPGFPEWTQEFNVGGPVFIPKVYNGRNKTFFFFDLHMPRGSTRELPTVTSLPTKAMQAGNFQNFPVKPKDPLTGQPFPNNMIPSNRISPVAQKIMNDYYLQFTYVGDPNSFTQNATINSGVLNTEHQFTMKFDENIGTKDFISFSYEHTLFISTLSREQSAVPPGFTSVFPTVESGPLPEWRWSIKYSHPIPLSDLSIIIPNLEFLVHAKHNPS